MMGSVCPRTELYCDILTDPVPPVGDDSLKVIHTEDACHSSVVVRHWQWPPSRAGATPPRDCWSPLLPLCKCHFLHRRLFLILLAPTKGSFCSVPCISPEITPCEGSSNLHPNCDKIPTNSPTRRAGCWVLTMPYHPKKSCWVKPHVEIPRWMQDSPAHQPDIGADLPWRSTKSLISALISRLVTSGITHPVTIFRNHSCPKSGLIIKTCSVVYLLDSKVGAKIHEQTI